MKSIWCQISALLFALLVVISNGQRQQCRQLRVRKEIHDLSESEWSRYLEAVRQLVNRRSVYFARPEGQRESVSGQIPVSQNTSTIQLQPEQDISTNISTTDPQVNKAAAMIDCAVNEIKKTMQELSRIRTFESGLLSDKLTDVYERLALEHWR